MRYDEPRLVWTSLTLTRWFNSLSATETLRKVLEDGRRPSGYFTTRTEDRRTEHRKPSCSDLWSVARVAGKLGVNAGDALGG